jgi:uncharacterized protein YecE (DUF72 family)
MPGRILTGTASWTDPGFVAKWYPPKLPASQRLRWYADHFNLVEVNSTFYRIPEARMVRSWCEQTPDGFTFDVKLHRLLSRHSTKPELLPPQLRAKAITTKGRVELTSKLEKAVTKQFLRGIEPFKQAGKLGALLLQLSPAFSPRHNELSDLDSLFELLQDYEVAVELRNGNWADPDHLPDARAFFSQRHTTFVMVDGPDDPHFTILPSIDLITTKSLAYLRAHGRNAQAYIRERTVAGRFDYDYPKHELEEIAERAARIVHDVEEMHVVYNNNKADYAPRAAATFQQILRQQYPDTLSSDVHQKASSYA